MAIQSNFLRTKQVPAHFWAHVVLSLALGGFVLVNWRNGRLGMADFRVYFDAAGTLLDGGSPYGRSFGLSSGYYKYAPVALLPWMLLQSLGWAISSTLYLVVMFSTMVAWVPKFVPYAHRFLSDHNVHLSRPRWWAVVLFALLTLQHLSRELLLGNVNWFLLVGVAVWWKAIRKPTHDTQQAVWAGALLAVICVFKPHFAILLPWVGWRRPVRFLAWTLAWGVTLLLLPSLWLGLEGNAALLMGWAGALLNHNTATITSFNAISGVFGLANSGTLRVVMPGLAVGLLSLWISRVRVVVRCQESLEVMVLVGVIPSLVLTDTEHFMWSFPLLAWWCLLLTSRSFWHRVPSWDRALTTLLFATFIVPYSFASPDLWGQQIGRYLEHGGPLGVSNLFLVIGTIWMHYVYRTSD